MSEEREMSMREEFNSTVRPHYQATHTPQCKKCMRFHPWGNNIMHVHHIVPIVDGGTNDESNLVTLCWECHEEWHAHREDKIDFNTWLHIEPPGFVYAAVGLFSPPEKKAEMMAAVDKLWVYVKEKRMLTEPYATKAYRKYTEKHCTEWVDW